jgi:hypothetical protein
MLSHDKVGRVTHWEQNCSSAMEFAASTRILRRPQGETRENCVEAIEVDMLLP